VVGGHTALSPLGHGRRGGARPADERPAGGRRRPARHARRAREGAPHPGSFFGHCSYAALTILIRARCLRRLASGIPPGSRSAARSHSLCVSEHPRLGSAHRAAPSHAVGLEAGDLLGGDAYDDAGEPASGGATAPAAPSSGSPAPRSKVLCVCFGRILAHAPVCLR
jgi:hypothetical protein